MKEHETAGQSKVYIAINIPATLPAHLTDKKVIITDIYT